MLSYVFWKGSLPISRMRGHEAHRTEGRDDNICLIVFQTSLFDPLSISYVYRYWIPWMKLYPLKMSWFHESKWIIAIELFANQNEVASSQQKFLTDGLDLLAMWNVPISRIFHEEYFPKQLNMYAIGRKKGKNMLLPRRSQSPSTLPSFELLRNRSQRPATLFPAPLLLSLPC